MRTHLTVYAFLPAVLLLNGLAVSTANASVTYTYTGSTGFACYDPHMCVYGSLQNERVFATLIFSAPLGDSLEVVENFGRSDQVAQGSSDPTLTYWSLADALGYVSFNSTSVDAVDPWGDYIYSFYSFSANILTDDSGDIENDSTIFVTAGNVGVYPCTLSCYIDIGGLAGDSLEFYLPCGACYALNQEPGEWTITPEPSTTALGWTGGAILLIAVRRKHRARLAAQTTC
jgi:hypothetical protein